MKTTLLLSTFIAFFGLAIQAQESTIIYTDIDPDVISTLEGEGSNNTASVLDVVAIDFNQDGVEEYNFRWDYFDTDSWFLHMTFAENENNDMAVTDENDLYFISAIPEGNPINDSEGYLFETSFFPEPFIGSSENPNFKGQGENYIGCRFVLEDSTTHFGWIRVEFDNDLNFTVKDYAYESVPNLEIIAGDTGQLSINNPDLQDLISVYPNPAHDYLTIETAQATSLDSVVMYDISGKVVLEERASLTSINVSSLSSGLYILKAIDTKGNSFQTKVQVK